MLFLLGVAHKRHVNSNSAYKGAFPETSFTNIVYLIHKYDANSQIGRLAVDRQTKYWHISSGLTASYVPGFVETFDDLLQDMIIHTGIGEGDELVDNFADTAVKAWTGLFPAVVVEHVRTARLTVHDRLLGLAHNYLETLMASPDCPTRP